MGVKRKSDEMEFEFEGNQRQSVLNISMCKLQNPSARKVEPSLLKSVLILNTLKHIETELRKEGISSELPPSATLTFHNDAENFTMDVLPLDTLDGSSEYIEQDMSDLHINGNLPQGMDSSEDQSISKAPLPPFETFVELSNSSNHNANSSPKNKVTSQKFDIWSSSLQTNIPFKVEDVLADTDLSQCDFDIFTSLSSTIKLTPLSAEEVLHSFPSNTLSDSYQTFLSTSCKSDILPEEIDNIMQILVGT
ncbi:cell division cycle-associated protein 4-like [Crassostrea virginica]|uniref:Uncharacterized protein LOC111130349 n=1 Tax=Crassostrea virginica TaxID=6565 RepID=A0A8B8DYK1_CRAVI|nr:uncharacterized protein LOC111130349 [Crassostrea virginica]